MKDKKSMHDRYMAESEEWFRIRSMNQSMREFAQKIIDLSNQIDQDLARRGVKMEYENETGK
jgi:hypothetical protein